MGDWVLLADMTVPGQLDRVRDFAPALHQHGSAVGLSDEALIDLELAVVEAANNVVTHGYGSDQQAVLRMRIFGTGNGVAVEIADHGTTISDLLARVDDAVPKFSESGRGLAIIRACVDTLKYQSEGGVNRLTLFKELPR